MANGHGRGRGDLRRTVRLVAPLVILGSCLVTSGLVAAARLGAPGTAMIMVAPAGTNPAHIDSLSKAILPDGRMVTPHGTTIQVGLEPFGSAVSPDGKTLLLTDSGNDGGGGPVNAMEFVSTSAMTITSRLVKPGFFVGAAFSPDAKTAYASVVNAPGATGVSDAVVFHPLASVDATKDITVTLRPGDFPAGLSLSRDGKMLYVAALGDDVPGTGNAVYMIDTAAARVLKRVPVGNYPYQAQVSPDGSTVYVSNWGLFRYSALPTPTSNPLYDPPSGPGNLALYGSSVWALDAHTGAVKAQIAVGPQRLSKSTTLPSGQVVGGSHPSALAFSKDGKTLYVATTTDDSITTIDTASNKVTGSISLAPYANAPKGTYPNALALSPDGSKLFAAEAGINAVAVIDTASGKVLGHIPAGFYPTGVNVSPDGKTLYVVNGKGVGAGPNGAAVQNPDPSIFQNYTPSTYDQNIQFGTLSFIDLASEDLTKDTQEVLANNGYVPTQVQVPAGNPIPVSLGGSSPIKHIIFLTKENRTWDQVMGDYPRGNNDPSLVLYGKNITPNQHAFADQYATDDNFFADAQSSGEGHAWLQAATATDFNDKTQVMGYSGRMAGYLHSYEYENVPEAGLIYSNLANHGLTYRIYGDAIRTLGFSSNTKIANALDYTSPTTNTYVLLGVNSPAQPGVQGHIDLKYPSYNLKVTDTRRALEFIREFNSYGSDAEFPAFNYLWLPNDHASGQRAGYPSPSTAVADNDQAVGLIVAAVARSPFWKDTAIFITEDDAQDGTDHVDAYRTIDYVISPWVKPGYMSHVHYDTASMLRTMELILGLPPMSQYDAAATPMYDLFDTQPHLKNVYLAQPLFFKPQLNIATSRFAALSARLNLGELDRYPAVMRAIEWAIARGNTEPANAR